MRNNIVIMNIIYYLLIVSKELNKIYNYFYISYKYLLSSLLHRPKRKMRQTFYKKIKI